MCFCVVPPNCFTDLIYLLNLLCLALFLIIYVGKFTYVISISCPQTLTEAIWSVLSLPVLLNFSFIYYTTIQKPMHRLDGKAN